MRISGEWWRRSAEEASALKGAGFLDRSDHPIVAEATSLLYQFDRKQAERGITVIGIDEAGRGPLAGPVVAAAVMLDYKEQVEGINDSKKLPDKERVRLYPLIIGSARDWAIGTASVEEIDRINILEATLTAMYRAVCGLQIAWDCALIDGNRVLPQLPAERQRAIVGGDGCSASIAAASIIAKVTRDRMMLDFHRQYPDYRFDRHKGYGTAQHRSLIRQFGLCPIHRKTFCSELVLQTELDL
jgi:ribonuclease HII